MRHRQVGLTPEFLEAASQPPDGTPMKAEWTLSSKVKHRHFKYSATSPAQTR